jgi:uncharacterized protein (TIGR02284 family)
MADGGWQMGDERAQPSAIGHPPSFLNDFSRRVSEWWRRRSGATPAPGASWDPLGPATENEGTSIERARLAERIMLLATLCRASYGGFSNAAQHTHNDALSEWLSSCARQRKALASELRGIVLVLAESDATSPPWQRWVAQVATENSGGWGESWIGRCIRGEENLLRLYDQLFAVRLPSGISAMLRRQYEQVEGTLERLRGERAVG